MRARRPLFRRSTLALAAFAATWAADPALAATCTWNPAAGAWNNPASWSCGFVPGNVDLAVIAAGKTVTVTGAQPATSVNNSGVVDISNNSSLGLTGSNTNNGNISLNSAGNATDLVISGLTTLAGTGTITTSNTQANRIIASGASTLTLGAGQTVQGAMQIGAGGALTLVNNGTIAATSPAGITINTTAGVTNNGVLRADGGTMTLLNTSFSQGASGTLNALNGSVLQLSDASVTGGILSSGSGGAVATTNGTSNNVLTGVTNTGTFNIVNNSKATMLGGLTNNGTINFVSAGNATDLLLGAGTSQTLGGTGTVVMSNTQANRIYGSNATLTLGGGQTITGAGNIGTIGGAVPNFTLVNQGTIVASSGAGMLIDATTVTNTGTLRADGGTLLLRTTVNSGGGNIEARNGSQVQLLNGAVINNANFSASGAGSLITTVSGGAVTLGGGTVNGSVTIANNSSVRLTGDLTYNGTLSMNSAGNNTDLILSGARTIGGAATIEMSNTTANRIYAANPGDSFTLASGATMRGSAQLGTGTALAVTNNGSIIATLGSPLLVETTSGLTNNGVMRADGGTLQFGNVVVNSAGGTIEARNGSRVELLNGSTINNANFSSTGVGSLITTVSGGTTTLGGGTVAGPMTIANNSTVRLTGNLTYNGTLSMASAGNITDLVAVGARTIGGTATIDMSNTTANRIYAASAADSLTFGSGITVQGGGSIGAGSATTITNNGAWIATLPAGITLNTTGAATNNNLIRGDASTFAITGTSLVQGASGTLSAISNGRIQLNLGTTVTGGSFATASGGQVIVTSGNRASISDITNAGTLAIQNNGALDLRGALTNSGALNFESAGNLTDLRVFGSQTIGGTGAIGMSNTTANRIVAGNPGDSLTLGSGQTLQGAGSIGAGTQLNLTNNGVMVGNLGAALVFSSTGGVTNNNAVRADAGNVVITGATSFAQGAGGTLSAINGGVVQLVGSAVISGGTLTTASGGQMRTSSGDVATIANLANTGTVTVVNNSSLRLQGTVNNSGAINLDSAGNSTDLRIVGLATLAGSGTTSMSNTTANRFVADAAGAQLTLGSGQTVQGAGQIGAATAMGLVNQGTITANVSSPLTVAMTGGVQNAAGGLMQATSGTLNLSNVVANTGTLAAQGGTVNASAGFTGTGTALISGAGQLNVGAGSTVGTLTHNGSAAAGLALGANSITVSSDYTNANSGSGNAFNRRTNVTGTGQILAGGTAAQVITGAGVINGTTTNATLTIGSVRVGANNFDYQVANGGASGPTLRGAVQTSVNGANLTDARLSGTGVTASNFNAGGPGGSGETRTVTFTAASAGALAPMSGQVLNLRSNFDNIADQKLNIVLASGAAAYNAAVGSATSPVVLANQRVGGTGSATLAISNAAAPGAFSEDLNASIVGTSGAATATGSVTGRIAGTSNTGTGAITTRLDTTSAGAKTGGVNLAYQTAGTVAGVSNGLAAGSAGVATVLVSGNVYQAASGQLLSAPLNFGTLQVGQTATQNLVVRNTATGAAGFVEDLNASFGAAGNSQITGAGALNGILAGNSSTAANGTMTVTVTATTVGSLASSIGVNYFSAGAVNGVGNGLGTLAVGSESFGVNGSITTGGTVINQASPQVNTPVINLGAVRVGAASPGAAVSVSNVATAAPQAALNAVISPASGPATASGSFNLLNPGATDTTSLRVGLNTATAGNFTGAGAGTATIAFVSDASNVGGCAPSCGLTLASQTVRVEGKVYTAAAGQLATGSVNFGVVRVGDTVSARNITIDNTAAATALNDTLRADVSGLSGPFAGNGTVSGIAAGGSGTRGIGLDTSAAGVYSGSGTVSFLSQNADMADVSAGPDALLSVFAQVNNLANGDFDLLSGTGTLTQSGTDYELDLGTLVVGSSIASVLQLDNEASGPADALSGLFDLSAANDFSFGGWGAVGPLAAGAASGPLSINWLAGATGLFTDSIVFNGLGTNASDTTGLAQTRRLTIRALVVNGVPPGTVPEPSTWMLLLAAGGAAAWARRRALKGAAR